ncbi:YcbK family protein [Azospirillum picis]|uniref:Murein endopeptidase K n=1 Tax=Azospirillum picis TaxID=488438 RepID=A0ABU0MSX3_9PROT|nr:DUF882 domain-containing protein [Azospirillum picis]MBP2301970.1 uncharacterized protein YcbK (DUF882 family) [Azospirillum picis]MDQ0536419.1 uncharacterized protein YcbK (DUF882 family) [Azospirillum picis]
MRITGRALGILAVLAAAAQLAGCATDTRLESAKLDGEPRSVVLSHPASGESVSATYWRPGDGYDMDALRDISVLFRDRRTDETIPVDPALVDMLVELRRRTGAPDEAPIRLTSGYRSSATNASLARSNPNVAENSYHMRGQAADFSIAGIAPARLAEEAAAMQRGGYAMYPHTGHVHVDTGPFRTWTPKGAEPRAPQILEAQARARAKARERALAQATPTAKTTILAASKSPAMPAVRGRVQVAETTSPGKVPTKQPARSAGKPVQKTAARAAGPDMARVRVALAQDVPPQKPARR